MDYSIPPTLENINAALVGQNVTVGTLAIGGATIGTDALSVTGTTSFGGALTLPQGTPAAPTLTWAGSTIGFFASGGSSYLTSGGVRSHRFYTGGSITVSAGGGYYWSSTSDADATADLLLVRDAAGTLAQRNSTNAQTLRVYNTYTDASNYERVRIGYASNILKITGEIAGSGTNRSLLIQADGITTVGLEDSTNNPGSASVGVYRNDTSGNTQFAVGGRGSGLTSTSLLHTRLMPIINQASGTYTILDINPTETAIGAGPHYLIQGRIGGGANVFSVTNGGTLFAANHIFAGAGSNIAWNGRSLFSSPADGNIVLKNNAGTDFGLLQFGGTTSSFPAIKRVSGNISFRRADDGGPIYITSGGSQTTAVAVASLPAAASWAGMINYVTDATATTSRSIVAGGGANKVMVWSDGTNWLIF